MQKKAFTLIEMMVVMGIIAIFSLLGAGAFLSTRDQQILDGATQQVLDSIREAQNNALSVKKDVDGGNLLETKAWGVRVYSPVSGTNQVELLSYNSDSLNSRLTHRVVKTLSSTGITYKLSNSNGTSLAAGNAYISYASPFGAAYVYGLTTSNSTGCANPATFAACRWVPSQKPTQEWTLIKGNNIYTQQVFLNSFENSTERLLIEVKYKNLSSVINVTSSGEAYVQ